MPTMNVPDNFAGIQPAWHRIGSVLSLEAQYDYMLALEDAGLNYRVEKLQFPNPLYSDDPTVPQFVVHTEHSVWTTRCTWEQ